MVAGAVGGAGGQMPRAVEEAIGRHLLELGDECLDLLRLAAVLGDEFPMSLLEEASQLPGGRLALLVVEAVRGGVLADRPGGELRLGFAHGIVRNALYRGLEAGRRAELHRRAALAILRAVPGGLGREAEIAHHFARGPRADAPKAARWARLAGDRAMARLAYEEAARQYALAVEVLDWLGDPDPGERAAAEAGLALARARSAPA